MSYQIDLITKGGGRVRAFDYDADNQTLIPLTTAVALEQDGDEWAIKICGDYALIYDSEGLSVGDLVRHVPSQLPRLEFFRTGCGIRTRITALSKDGMLMARELLDDASLPTGGINLLGDVHIADDGTITADGLNEIWLLVNEDGDYICDDEGRLIRTWR